MKNSIITLFLLLGVISGIKADVIVTNAVEFQAALDDPAEDNVIIISGTIFGRFIVNRSGTVTEPLIIRGGTISGLGVPDTSAGLDFALLSVLSESNVRIENVTFENNYIQGAKGIYVTTASWNDAPLQNIFIDSCTLRDIGWSSDNTANPESNPSGTGQAHGILVTGRTANTLTNINVTNNNLNNIITGNSEALTVNGDVSEFLVQGNTISNITNIGIDIAGGFNVALTGIDQARNGSVVGNTVFNCRRPSSVSGVFEPAGIYVDGGANVEIYGNRSYQNGQGFSIGREQAGETLNITMTNNLSYFNAENGLVFGGNLGTVINSTVRNNTFFQNGADRPSDRSGISVQFTQNCSITNNIIYEPGSNTTSTMFGISNFFGGTPPTVEYNLVNGMESFNALVNVGTNPNGLSVAPDLNLAADFAPNTGSQVIDAGNSSGIPANETDFLGATRINGASVDIGAVESASVNCVASTLTPSINTPYLISVWRNITEVTEAETRPVWLRLQTTDTGTYSWTGPNGVVVPNNGIVYLNNISPADAGAYTGTFTNDCGEQSSVTFTVNVIASCADAELETYYGINAEAEVQDTTVQLNEGDYLYLSPQSDDTSGTWSWSGPSGFTSSDQVIEFDPITAANGGNYTVTYTLGTCQETANYSVLLNSTSSFPDPSKKYYIDNRQWNVRLGADGDQEALTESITTTGNNVEWVITPSPTAGYYYIDCVGGGNAPRLRSDQQTLADMQATSSAGSWTRWMMTDVGNGYYYLSTLYESDFMRLQVTNTGDVRTVASRFTGSWTHFKFTEVGSSAKNITSIATTTSQVALYPVPVQDELNVSITDFENFSSYDIIDLNGSVQASDKITNSVTHVSVNSLNNGMYLIRLYKNGQLSKVKKFIK